MKHVDGQPIPTNAYEILSQPQWRNPGEREAQPADPELALRNYRDKVAAKCPAAAAFWGCWDIIGLRHLVPLLMEDLSPGPEFPSIEAGLRHYEVHPRQGLALVTGAQNDHWTLLGLQIRSVADWQRWVRPHATVERLGPRRGGEQVVIRDLLSFGQPVQYAWERVPGSLDDERSPWAMPFKSGQVLTEAEGNVDQLSRLAVLEANVVPSDCWLVLHVPGRRQWKARRLADGVELLAPGAVVPMVGQRGVYKLVERGNIARPEPSGFEWTPPWLLEALKVR